MYTLHTPREMIYSFFIARRSFFFSSFFRHIRFTRTRRYCSCLSSIALIPLLFSRRHLFIKTRVIDLGSGERKKAPQRTSRSITRSNISQQLNYTSTYASSWRLFYHQFRKRRKHKRLGTFRGLRNAISLAMSTR